MSQPLKTLCLLLLLPLGAAASTLSISSSKIRFNADTDTFFGYAQTAGPPALNLLYSAITSSHIVFNYDGNLFDMQDSADSIPIPLHAVGSGLGAFIEGAKQEGNLVFVERFTIVNNPRTGLQPDTIQYTLSVTNTGSVSLPIGARLLMDLQVNGADYSPLSINNGISTISVNSIFRSDASGVPQDWWAYDIDPSLGTPTLSARGVTKNNPFDTLATPPDAMEDVDWDDVENVPWDPEPNMGVPFSSYGYPDNCVVLWWTGSGQEGNTDTIPSINLGPGETRQFITYFGLSQDKLKATATPIRSPSPSPSASPTFSVTATRTPSPTTSPSFTPSPTFSISPTLTPSFTSSPTFSFSPTASPSSTQTQTHTFSPTATPTASLTPSFSASPTFSATPSFTRTPSFTFSPSSTASPSLTPSFTASPSFSQTPSVTLTYTITWTRTITPTYTPTPPTLLLSPKPPNPNPSNGNGVYLPYVLTLNATVRIKVYTVAGELLRSLDPFSAKVGANEQFWNERNDSGALVASGIFIYRIEAIADDNESKSAFMKLAVVR